MGRSPSFLQRLLLRDGVNMMGGGVASQIPAVEIGQFDWCSSWSICSQFDRPMPEPCFVYIAGVDAAYSLASSAPAAL